MSKHQAIVITAGDPAGIGPEIVARAYRDAPDVLADCCVLGAASVMQRAALLVGGVQLHSISSPGAALGAPPRCIPMLPCADADRSSGSAHQALPAYGQISAGAGLSSSAWVRQAAEMALRGEVAAMVTAPIHKEAWDAAGVPFAGHTELLQSVAAAFARTGLEQMPVRMMLANEELRTVLVSIHVSLRQALEQVSTPNVLQTIQITHQALQRSLGRVPRIAVAGLNPHAGEGGLFGREEIEQIVPAIEAARAQGVDVQGPFPPDTVFMKARGFRLADVVIAMYHDQGLIPVKYMGVEKGVNVTLGLHNGQGRALIRTSPDHGTAFDIAGQGKADASSLIEAVRQAKALVRA